MDISSQTFKRIGIIVMAVAVVIAIYSFLQGSTEFTVQVGGVRPAISQQSGSTRFYQVGGIIMGMIVFYGGFRAYKYIPMAERDEGPIEYDS